MKTHLLFIFLILSFLAQPALSDPLKIVPVLSLTQAYDDNILFSNNNEEQDFITTASGRIHIKQKTRRLDARLKGKLDKVIYQTLSEYNSLDKSLSGQADYSVSERINIGAHAQYVQDSQKDSKLESSGLVILGDRKTKDFSLSGSYLFTEKIMGKIDMGFRKETIKKNLDKENNEIASTSWTLSKDLSQNFSGTTGLFSISYFNSESAINEYFADNTIESYKDYTSDIWQIYSGFSKDISEHYTFYIQAGGNYSKTREEARTASNHSIQESDRFGGVFFTGLNYSGEKSKVKIDVSHDLRQGSGTNGAVERSSVTFGVEHKVTDNFSATFKTYSFLNKNKRETSADIDDLTFNVQPGFKYKIGNGLILSGMYKATVIENRQDNTSSKRNLVYIGITKTFNELF